MNSIKLIFFLLIILFNYFNFLFSQNTETDVKQYEKKIFFVIEDSNNLYQIGMMDIDGKNKKILTNKGNNWCPAVSPNGDKIAFYSDRSNYVNLWMMNNDGARQTQLTLNLENINIIDLRNRGQISWNNEEIYFLMNKNIWKIDITGHSPSIITKTNDITSFKLSPDGKKWLFSREKTKFHNGLWTMNYNTSGLIQITESNIFNPIFDWGLNNQVVYLQNRGISIINYDGTNNKLITNVINLNNDIAWAKFDNNVKENNLIAFIDNNYRISAVSLDGKIQKQITLNDGFSPFWLDRETLIYIENHDIYLTNINNFKKQRLTYSFKAYYPVAAEIANQINNIISKENNNE